ncbi:hypothetical protein CC78DRAFT_614974 [Lojkania enalia]|uniref:Pathway-specific nitrogen regulator n=1 Tax=Lojkania enalia TaxID=147567 RepID=A0A9P4KE29_9PLEO|nr:hypothetical protein CC78DRAFT_614974 [Didymosphaeria enalia]
MTTIHHSPPPDAPPFVIYEDPEDQEPPSPSEVYEGDASFNSGFSLPSPDEPVASIEREDGPDHEPEPYDTTYTSKPTAQTRHVSGVTTTSFISSLPSELSISSKPIPPPNQAIEARYTPRKERPPFRNPSSVRAMQMSSPPSFNAFESPRDRLKGSYKLTTPSRSGRSETPVSMPGSRRSSSRRGSQQPAHESPRPTPTPQQHLPLVLLHVTILPMQFPYPLELIARTMPEWLMENYKLLEEKLRDIVLMRRGLLIQHPREEYDVLEERILESLELKTPRLLKCGHFVGGGTVSEEESDDEENGSVTDDDMGRGSRMSGGTITVDEEGELKCSTPELSDENMCVDCHRQIKRPGKGVGVGKKRWDIKIYAANGLMRAGAWSAAWSEMERCDVEISPWIPEDVRKAMEQRIGEEQAAEKERQMYKAEVQRRVEEEAARSKKLEEERVKQMREDEAALQRKVEEEEAERKRAEERELERERFDHALEERIEEAKESIRLEFEAQALAEASAVAERFRALEQELKKEQEKYCQPSPSSSSSSPLPQSPHPTENHRRHQSRGRHRSTSRRPAIDEIPLGTLLRNYILLLARDQKNIAIIVLSVFVVFLSMHMKPNPDILPSPSLPNMLLSMLPDDETLLSTASVVATTTATTTTLSISTTTVTQIEHRAASFSEEPVLIPPLATTKIEVEQFRALQDATVSQVEASGEPSAVSSQAIVSKSIHTAIQSESLSMATVLDDVQSASSSSTKQPYSGSSFDSTPMVSSSSSEADHSLPSPSTLTDLGSRKKL